MILDQVPLSLGKDVLLVKKGVVTLYLLTVIDRLVALHLSDSKGPFSDSMPRP